MQQTSHKGVRAKKAPFGYSPKERKHKQRHVTKDPHVARAWVGTASAHDKRMMSKRADWLVVRHDFSFSRGSWYVLRHVSAKIKWEKIAVLGGPYPYKLARKKLKELSFLDTMLRKLEG